MENPITKLSTPSFGAQLVAWRAALKLTQAECAQILGVGIRTLYRWEDDEDAAPAGITQEGALARLRARAPFGTVV